MRPIGQDRFLVCLITLYVLAVCVVLWRLAHHTELAPAPQQSVQADDTYVPQVLDHDVKG